MRKDVKDNDDKLSKSTASSTYQTKLTDPLTKSDVINNLTTTTTNVPLSAAQGKALNDNKLDKSKLSFNGTSNWFRIGADVNSSVAYIDIGIFANDTRYFYRLNFNSNGLYWQYTQNGGSSWTTYWTK